VFSFLSPLVIAQTEESLAIEKIIVTAQRQPESMQSTPVSISAISEDQIEKLQIDNAKDLSQVMPNVLIQPATGGSGGIAPYIRGGGVADGANITSEAEVGIYIDDVYQPRSAASFIESLDISRVEVLRGPQGTLYGRNSSAGALKVITRIPDEIFRFKNEFGIGSWDEVYDKLSISGALTDDEALRGGFSGMWRDRDGGRQYNLTQDKDVGAETYKGFQTDHYYTNDTFNARLKAYYSDYESDGLYASAVDPYSLENEYDDFAFTSGELDTVLSPYESFTRDKQYGASLHLNKTLSNDIALTSITSWGSLEDDWATGFSGGVSYALLGLDVEGYTELFSRESTSNQYSFTQELQIQGDELDDALHYMVGVYYFNERGNQEINSAIFFTPSTTEFEVETDSYALFGQVDYELSERVKLILGGRYTREDKTLNAEITGESVNRGDEFSKFTSKVAMNYQLSDDILLYSSYTEGFKAGGYNSLAETATALNSPFDMQEVQAYEVGMKSEWLKNRLRFNVAGFFNDYENLQQQSVSETGAFLTENYDAEHKGIEAELSMRLTTGLTVWANGVVQDSEYTDGEASDGSIGSLLGNSMTNVFDYQYAAGLDYSKDIGPGTLLIGANVNHRDDYYSTSDNAEIGHVRDVTLVDAYLSYEYDDWKISLTGKNITDEKYWFTGFGFSLVQNRFMADPATWRLGIKYEI
jgi:iron complex outermembrane receptor protein